MASKLALRALEIARSEIGTREVTTNWGSPKDPSDVDDFLKSVGITFPAPWCMAFVYWCFEQAAKELGVPNPVPRTGGVAKCWSDAKDKRVLMPQKGDLFVMLNPNGTGHIGFVDNVPGLTFSTIEGNTNEAGSREGVMVRARERMVGNTIKGFLRF